LVDVPLMQSIVLPPLLGLRSLHLHAQSNDTLLKEVFISEALEVLWIDNPPGYGSHTWHPKDPVPLPMPASTRLKEVMLRNLGMKDFPLWLLDQPELTLVSLPLNKLSVVPADWSHLSVLKTFDISHNLVRSLPPGIKLPASLENINLSGNRLKKVPIELAQLPKLNRLSLGTQTNQSLSDTTLDDIPSEISLKPGLKLEVKLRKQDLRRMRARNAAALMHLGRPWEGELTRDWEKPSD
jgi:Leucine-rich repeat (LRR) protein